MNKQLEEDILNDLEEVKTLMVMQRMLNKLRNVDVKFKKTHPNSVIPSYALPGDAGLDLTATSMELLENGKVKYGLGLAMEIPEGHVGLIFPRSSIHKTTLRLSNSTGIIDSQFRGEVSAIFDDISKDNTIAAKKHYNVGDRVCQLVVLPFPQVNVIVVDELEDTQRGSGGFGSTGS